MIAFLMKYMFSAKKNGSDYTWVVTARNLFTTILILCGLVISVTAGFIQTLNIPTRITKAEEDIKIFQNTSMSYDTRLRLLEANINSLNSGVDKIARNTEQIQVILMRHGK